MKGVKCVKDVKSCDLLTDSEVNLLCQIINDYGEGSHPWADADSFDGFAFDYVKYCLSSAIMDSNESNPNYSNALTIREKLNTDGIAHSTDKITINNKIYKMLGKLGDKNYDHILNIKIFNGSNIVYQQVGEEIAHLKFDWDVICDKRGTKADLIKDCGLDKYTFDFALPQQWVNSVVDEYKLDYHMFISTTVFVYTEFYNHGIAVSCCNEVQTVLDKVQNIEY